MDMQIKIFILVFFGGMAFVSWQFSKIYSQLSDVFQLFYILFQEHPVKDSDRIELISDILTNHLGEVSDRGD